MCHLVTAFSLPLNGAHGDDFLFGHAIVAPNVPGSPDGIASVLQLDPADKSPKPAAAETGLSRPSMVVVSM